MTAGKHKNENIPDVQNFISIDIDKCNSRPVMGFAGGRQAAARCSTATSLTAAGSGPRTICSPSSPNQSVLNLLLHPIIVPAWVIRRKPIPMLDDWFHTFRAVAK